jgi:signal transduction histidine kinase
MVVLFSSFLIAFVTNQRKKLKYHKDLRAIQEEQQRSLMKQNILLEEKVNERTSELLLQKNNLQKALSDLEKSQLQLIQKEKMASLGELTSGVAHEIQNPLNFVINFSEVSSEMLNEMKEMLASEQLSESLKNDMDPMVDDIIDNIHKIQRHGKRADNIVKNMLQHSRIRSGEMELTDINSLIEEYQKLGYQSFKAVNKHYECTISMSLDSHLEKMNIVPEDIGSLVLNLLNNAFYSTKEKKKTKGAGYMPAVSITTSTQGDKTLITIRDNGIGINSKFLDKIYQPFFTTKPTGEGTGLGLSLSYDIVKAHQGELKVRSVEGEFAEFTVELNY